jgi:hypothetical protein
MIVSFQLEMPANNDEEEHKPIPTYIKNKP